MCYLPLALWLLVGVPNVGTALFMVGAVWTLAAGGDGGEAHSRHRLVEGWDSGGCGLVLGGYHVDPLSRVTACDHGDGGLIPAGAWENWVNPFLGRRCYALG